MGPIDAGQGIWTETAVECCEVELGDLREHRGKKWVAVALPNGQRGYLRGDARIYEIQLAKLLQESVDVYAQPSAQSALVTQYKQNARFYLTDTIGQGSTTWIGIRDSSGTEGFVHGQTRIKVIPDIPEGAASRNKHEGIRVLQYDSTHKICKHVRWSGEYAEGFEPLFQDDEEPWLCSGSYAITDKDIVAAAIPRTLFKLASHAERFEFAKISDMEDSGSTGDRLTFTYEQAGGL